MSTSWGGGHGGERVSNPYTGDISVYIGPAMFAVVAPVLSKVHSVWVG